MIESQIKSGVDSVKSARLLRGSDGTLYSIYVITATAHMCIGYSTDAGVTWTQVDSGIVSSYFSFAIDSQDNIHISYKKNADGKLWYVKFSALAFGTPENIDAVSTIVSQPSSIAVDSADNPHVIWTVNVTSLFYSKRTAGTWSARLELATFDTQTSLKIAIDSNDHIYVIYLENSVRVNMVKYNGSWAAAITLGNTNLTSATETNLVVDSSNNVWVVWLSISGANLLRYNKYTKATDSWGGDTIVVTVVTPDDTQASIAIDSSNVISVLFQAAGGLLYLIQNTAGVWGSEGTVTPTLTPTNSKIESTVYPILGGENINETTAGYHFTYYDAASSALRYYASSAVDFPAPQTKNYSRKASASLPSTDANLSNLFTSTGYANVLSEDSLFEDQSATGQYSIFLFKNQGNAITDPINVSWIGKSSIAPSESTVYLQIYNRNSGLWETLDSNAIESINTVFTLTGAQLTSLSNYYDASLWVSCRVYQLAT